MAIYHDRDPIRGSNRDAESTRPARRRFRPIDAANQARRCMAHCLRSLETWVEKNDDMTLKKTSTLICYSLLSSLFSLE